MSKLKNENKEFRKLLIDVNLTYEEFADKIGVDKATLTRYLNTNFSNVKLKTIKEMQGILGTEEVNNLLGIA